MELTQKNYFVEEGCLRKEGEKKFYPFVFNVPPGTREIQIGFGYSPRVLKDRKKNYQRIEEAVQKYTKEVKTQKQRTLIFDHFFKKAYPLRNLLNLSLYEAKGRFVGRWDQNSEKPVRISSTYSSPGFTPCKIISGSWMVEIEAHAIVTEECRYRLDISFIQKTDEENLESLEKRLVNHLSYGHKKAWYSGELHVHSHHSDGKNSVEEIVEAAKEEKLDFVALTDHNTVSGFNSIPDRGDLLIIRGMELTTYYGHALALGLTSFIDWRSKGRIRSINRVINEVHAQRGLFAIAHPFSIGDPVCAGCTWELRDIDYRKIDLMEVWAGCWKEREIENYRSFRLWDKLLNQGFKVTGISGRDWHDLEEKKKGRIPRTFVQADSFSEDGILEGLRRGHVFVSSGPSLFFSAEYKGKRYECGDEIKLVEKKPINFQIQIKSIKEPSQLQVIKNGLKLFATSLVEKKDQRITLSDLPKESSWYRCEIYAKQDKELLCFTNPISISLF